MSPGKKRGIQVFKDPWTCPLQPEREALKSDEDVGVRVCGHLADVWELAAALTLEGMSQDEWRRWLRDEDSKRVYERAKELHRLRIYGQIRAMATGESFRRAQLPALRFLLRGLDSQKRQPVDRKASPSDMQADEEELPGAQDYGPMNEAELAEMREGAWPDDDSDDEV